MPNYKVAEGHRVCVDNVIYESGDNIVLDDDAAKEMGSSLEKRSGSDESSRTESGESGNTGEQRQQARRQPRS